MGNADLFHTLTLDIGGRFPRETAPADVREMYDEIGERANDLIAVTRRHVPNLPTIHFDFIWNSSINAVAFKEGGRYFIGINTGTLYMLRFVIGRILSDSRLFRRIGDPSKESSELGPLTDYSVDADEMVRQEALVTPQDQTRSSFAWFLQDQAIMFLVGHEIAHITRGHIDYLAKEGQAFAQEIVDARERREDEKLQSHAIEIDADGRSILARIDSLRVTFENPAIPPLPWAPDAQGPGQLIQDWAVSVNIVFHLFGDKRFRFGKLTESSHPPLLLRQMICNGKAGTEIERIWNRELKSVAQRSLRTAQTETNEAIATMLGIEFVQLPTSIGSGYYDYGMRIIDEWNSRLRFVMKDFAFEF